MTKSTSGFGENEKVLQAVVLADSFNERFMPITLDRPRCLLSLVNIPLIEYTFEFLAISGVQEVILFCRAHADQIKQYIGKSRWAKPTSTMHIQLVVNAECTSMGDALRDIDGRSLIHGDFILVCGDVVSNMNLNQALQTHRQRRQADSSYIMTMVLKECSPFHRSRERCENGIFAIDPQTGECLAYEPVESENLGSIGICVSSLLTSNHGGSGGISNGTTLSSTASSSSTSSGRQGLQIRYDLMDCQIDICSANVLALYTENFDYQDVRKDFLRGILTSEILGVRVATHVVAHHEYASRVRSPHLYDSISRDIIERWTFPLVPDADLLEEQSYIHRRGNIYLAPQAMLSRSALLERNVVLGVGVSVGDNSIIRNSVIGPRCRIGADVLVDNCYIWEGCVIEGGCRLYGSILADQVRVRVNTIVNRGCLVTSNTTIGPKTEIPSHTRVAKLGEHIDLALRQLGLNEGGEDFESLTVKQTYLGEASDGVVWEGSIDEAGFGGNNVNMEISGNANDDEAVEQDSEKIANELRGQEERRAAFEMGTSFHTSRPHFLDESNDEDDGDANDSDEFRNEHGDDYMNAEDGKGASTFGRNLAKFKKEGIDLVKHAIESNYLVDNALLEINSLKFSCNATFAECRQIILEALFDYLPLEDPERLQGRVARWAPLLARFTQGMGEQVNLVEAIQEACQARSGMERTFRHIIPILFKEDVIEEDAVEEWLSRYDATNSIYVRQIRPFVEWLRRYDDDGDDDGEVSDNDDDKEESSSSDQDP